MSELRALSAQVLAILLDGPAVHAVVSKPGPKAAPSAPTTRPPAAPKPQTPSRLAVQGDDLRQLAWQPGEGCPEALASAMAARLDEHGHLPLADDAALPLMFGLAADGRHALEVDAAVWPLVAAHRDARSRAGLLQHAYPEGPASPALQRLLKVSLPAFQAEAALWAVVAGRALLADGPGLGKGVVALAAARLWHQHFGLQRVLVLCPPNQALSWQRAARLLGGLTAQVASGSVHGRQALWQLEQARSTGLATTAEQAEQAEQSERVKTPSDSGPLLRILSPDTLARDAALVADWAPDLVVVDEPQRLDLNAALWAWLDTMPHALLLCGAALENQPELLERLVQFLDPQRLGPLAAWHAVRASRDAHQPLPEAGLQHAADQLSRVLLQRERAEVAEQLPPVVYSARLVPLGDAQRDAQTPVLAQARRLLAQWQRSGQLSDTEQNALASGLTQLRHIAQRADPADPQSGLSEPLVQALAAQLAEWDEAAQANAHGEESESGSEAEAAPPQRLLLCQSPADARQLAQRLGPQPGLTLAAPGDPVPEAPTQVLQVGVPWRQRRWPLGANRQALHGQAWVLVVADDSLDIGLLDTLGARFDTPLGLDQPGHQGLLAAEARQAWLVAVAAALQACPG